jgi:hypothetical protein
MKQELFEIAAKAMHVTVEEAQQHWKEIPEHDSYYLWNPVRGGISVIINNNGEKLAATSSVSFERHLKAFLEGRRN